MLHQMVGSLSRTHGYTDTHLHVRAGRQQVGSLQIRRQLGSSHSLGLGYRVGLPGGCACLCSSLLLLCTGLPWQCTRWRQVCKGSLSSLGGLLGLRLGCGWGLEGITMLPPHCEHLSAAHSVSRIFCTGGTEWRDQTPTPGPGELVLLQSREPRIPWALSEWQAKHNIKCFKPHHERVLRQFCVVIGQQKHRADPWQRCSAKAFVD